MTNKQTKVLILGDGYIGSSLYNHLSSAGILVDVYGSLSNGIDYTTLNSDLLLYYTHIVVLAGNPSVPLSKNLSKTYTNSILGLKILLKNITKSTLLIYASSASVYKNGKYLSEDTNITNIFYNYYDYSKYTAESILKNRGNSIILRFGTVYGYSPKYRDDTIINKLVYNTCIRTSTSVYNTEGYRTFLYIESIHEAIEKIIRNYTTITDTKVYNLGTHTYTIENICNIFTSVSNTEMTIGSNKSLQYNFSLSMDRWNSDFGLLKASTINIEELLQHTISRVQDTPPVLVSSYRKIGAYV